MPVIDAQVLEQALGVARTTKDQERLADGEFLCCRPTYIGRNILICGRKDSMFPMQCLVGPDWPCMLITYALIIVPTIVFFVLVASRLSWVVVLLGILSFCITLLCFSLTACSDPGIVYRKLIDEEAGLTAGGPIPPTASGGSTTGSSLPRAASGDSELPPTGPPVAGSSGGSSSGSGMISTVVLPQSRSGAPVDPNATVPCSRCEMARPMGASHCYDCNLCVKGLDHHCPWTGKCIGKKNLRFFYAFLISLTVHILYVGIVTGMNAVSTAFHLKEP